MQGVFVAVAGGVMGGGEGWARRGVREERGPVAELVCAARTVPGELTAFLGESSRPELTVLVKTPETAKGLEELAPFTAAYPVPETGARYYLCQNGACAQPEDSISKVGWHWEHS